MTNDHNPIPRGLRINNPGNLRAAIGPDVRTVLVDGFASFATLEQGCTSLFHLIHQYYTHLGLTTLPRFVGRYAPSTENDVQAYNLAMARRLGINPLKIGTYDLRLDLDWKALDFARAIIHIEQGPVTVANGSAAEWVNPLTLITAMCRTAKWSYAR